MKKPTKKENALEWIKDIAIAVVIAFVFLQLLTPTLVREHSMENTLHQNDYVFVSRRYYTWFGHDYARGDIITLNSDIKMSIGLNKILVKRIIGIPGDTVSISDGVVYINGEAIEEPYTKDGYTSSVMEEVTVPDGCLFVLGDNRQNSTDSRSGNVGFVEFSRVRGKVVFRLFPFSRAGSL